MVFYILKSSACLAIFISFYKLFFEAESFHILKRFYLLFTLVFAFTIPLITFTQYVEISSTVNILQNNQPVVLEKIFLPIHEVNYWPTFLWSIYGLGMCLFTMKFLVNLFKIFSTIKKNPKYKKQSIINVLVEGLKVPHTFFSYIFLNKKEFEQHLIPKEVLLHEESHATQKHSIDVILIELLQIFFWFNPIIYIFKKAIKLNHEFLADQAVIKSGIQATIYQQILLSFSLNSAYQPLTNAINYSSIKKRFTIMKAKTSKRVMWVKSLALLPLLVGTIYIFSEKVQAIGQISLYEINIKINHKNKILLEEKEVLNLSELRALINKKIKNLNKEKTKNIVVNVGIHHKVLMGFITDVTSVFYDLGIYNVNRNIVIDQLPKLPTNKDKYYQNATFKIKQADGSFILKKYWKLSLQQKENLIVLPTKISKKQPSNKQLKEWLDDSKYGIWIDEKRVTNHNLQNYKPSDFSLYTSSRLEKNATNHGNHYFQVNLYTHSGFENTFGSHSDYWEPLTKETIVTLEGGC